MVCTIVLWAALGLSLPASDVVSYGADLRDRCWMFGHDSGQHDGPGNASKIPLSSKVTMDEACCYMGVSNVVVCVWHEVDDGYLEQFKGLKRVVWAVDNGYIKRHAKTDGYSRRLSAGLERMRKMPNLVGLEFDDFFNGYAQLGRGKDWLENGTEVEVQKGARTLSELRVAHRRIHSRKRPAEMRLVLYSEEIDSCGTALKPIVDQFDSVTVWTWSSDNLCKLKRNFMTYRREIAPMKPTFLGVYMWDFCGKKPMPDDALKAQLDLGLELFRSGLVEGFVFHCTPLVNKNLPSVERVREWISTHGDERFPLSGASSARGAKTAFGSSAAPGRCQTSRPPACKSELKVKGK